MFGRFTTRAVAAVSLSVSLAGLAFGSASGAATSHAAPRHGGNVTVLVAGGQWPGLDPATDTQDAADSSELNAIYGQLFEQGPNGAVIPSEASGYKQLNRLTVEIFIRKGQKFQDGTPFTAQAVASSIKRDLLPANSCLCLANFTAVSSITTKGKYTVVIHLKQSYAPLISSFIDEAPNWTVSPTALAKGETILAQHPVGAGPFEVVSNSASAQLVLKKYPGYWQKGRPYLSGITFISTGSDASDLDAVESGQAQMTGVTSTPIVQQARATPSIKVHTLPAISYEFVDLNEARPPFNNLKARQAVMYATNPKTIVSALYANLYKPVEAPTAPGDLFYEKSVPGALTYNPTKARALVQQLGGLSVTIGTTANTAQWTNESQALAQQWNAVGIKTTVVINSLQNMLQQLATNNWEAMDAQWGHTSDPANNLPTYFATGGALSGTKDSVVDQLMAQGAGTVNVKDRAIIYGRLFSQMQKNADLVPLYEKNTFIITAPTVEGLPTQSPIYDWENIWLK